jgi:hypothetical protein
MQATTFRVRIAYREPTYERYRGAPLAEPYTWVFAIHALDATQAKTLALAEFKALARNSGVGWRREVVGIELIERLAG